MAELGLPEYFSRGEAVGIIARLFVIFYFSRKQMQTFSVDIETNVLNDLDDRKLALIQTMVERPELIKVVSNVKADCSPEVVFSYHILYTFAHASHMRRRKVSSDNE